MTSRSGERLGSERRRGSGSRDAYQLKITLADVRPPVWRRVQVPASITLGELHGVIQTAMGWTNTHLHEYEINGARYGVPDPDWGDEDVRSEDKVRLCDVAADGSRLRYTYDFGDDWRHVIEVEKVLPTESGDILPRCLTGRRGCPPEDVGGPWGYAEFLDAYADPQHDEHEEMREWAGPYFDPEAFDADEVTGFLQGRNEGS